MIEVYHLNDKMFFDEEVELLIDNRFYDVSMGFKQDKQVKTAIELFNAGFYQLVAKVDSKNLSTAWEKTNYIEDSWTKNSGVEVFMEEPRSSKVGDVMKTEDGKYHVVASIGFTPIAEGSIVQLNSIKKVKP